MRRLEETPAVDRAAVTSQIPLMPAQAYSFSFARGRGKGAGDDARWTGILHSVTDSYFDTMDIRLLSGRTFDRGDRFTEAQLIGNAPRDHGVVIVTESTARMLWPGRPGVGKALWLPMMDSIPWWESDRRRRRHSVLLGRGSAGRTRVLSLDSISDWDPRLIVRGTASIATVREVAGAVHPGTHVEQIASLESLVSGSTAQPRFTTRLVMSFALLALLLAAVGIYGTLSFVVASRTREIGIRMALGASRGAIMTDVARYGVIPALAGSVVGLAAAFVLVRAFRALVFGIEPVDSLSFVGRATALLLVAHGWHLAPRCGRRESIHPLRYGLSDEP